MKIRDKYILSHQVKKNFHKPILLFLSGFRSRARKCYGIGCSGCDREWAECENPACADYTDVTNWTPWINTTQVSFCLTCF